MSSPNLSDLAMTIMFRNADTFPHIMVPFSTEEPFISHTPDVYIPFFTLIEFISYMGWIKVFQN